MDQKTRELAEGLRQALLAERAGSDFYALAAAQTQDPEGRQVFEMLAAEEKLHFDYLARHYQSVVKTGELARGVTLREAHQLATDHPIFSPALLKRLKESHFEMSALAIAVQLELNGLTHYKRMAERAHTPEAKRLFEELAEWESGHYDAFLRQQQMLLEQYFSEAGFEPF